MVAVSLPLSKTELRAIAKRNLLEPQRVNNRTPEVAAELCNVLEMGIPLQTAAPLLGMNRETVRVWAKDDPHFQSMIDHARAIAETKHLKFIGDSEDWKAQKQMLIWQNSGYDTDTGKASSSPQINITVNVPSPEPLTIQGSYKVEE